MACKSGPTVCSTTPSFTSIGASHHLYESEMRNCVFSNLQTQHFVLAPPNGTKKCWMCIHNYEPSLYNAIKTFCKNLDGLMATLLAQTWLFKSKSSKLFLCLFLNFFCLPVAWVVWYLPYSPWWQRRSLQFFHLVHFFWIQLAVRCLGQKREKSTSDKWNTGTTTKIMQVANYTNTSNTLFRVLVTCWK